MAGRRGIQRDQIFLRDRNVLEKEVRMAGVGGTDIVLDIGAGDGRLTEVLLETGARVVAVEKDETYVGVLEELAKKEVRLRVVGGDVLEMDLPEADVCVANIPYSIASGIVERLGDRRMKAFLLVQKEFGERLIGNPGSKNYSRLSVLSRYHYVAKKLFSVSRRLFSPVPRVDSVFISLEPRKERLEEGEEEIFFFLVRNLFTQKRKLVRRSFVDGASLYGKDKSEMKAFVEELPQATVRVKCLSVRDIVEITRRWLTFFGEKTDV